MLEIKNNDQVISSPYFGLDFFSGSQTNPCLHPLFLSILTGRLCYLILTLATTSSSLRSRCSLQAPNRFLHVAKINNGMSTHWSHYMYYCLHVCLVTDSCSPYHSVQKLRIPFGNCTGLSGGFTAVNINCLGLLKFFTK